MKAARPLFLRVVRFAISASILYSIPVLSYQQPREPRSHAFGFQQSAVSGQPSAFSNQHNRSRPALAAGLDTVLYLPLVLLTHGQPSGPPGEPNPPPPQGPGVPSIFGLNLYASNFGLEDLPDSNTHWIRPDPILWYLIEPEKGVRDWSSLSGLEQELRYASERGKEILVIVSGTPRWAQAVPDSFCGPIKPDELGAFASFMRDLVTRYSTPPYSVRYWEFWNEPDVDPSLAPGQVDFGCWGDEDDPYYGGSAYAGMLKAVYPQVKAADPQAQVLVGGLLLNCDPRLPDACQARYGDRPPRFLEGILRSNGGPYFDGVSFHGFDSYLSRLGQYENSNWGSSWDTTGPVLIAKAKFLKEVLGAYGFSDKYLIGSEAAVKLRDGGCDAECELTKAYYLTQLYAASLSEGLPASLWYCLRCSWQQVDLLSDSGAPLPAYSAYQVAWNALHSAAFTQEVGSFSGVKIYEFEQDGRRLWVAWSLDGQEHSLSLPANTEAVFDAMGESIPVSGGSLVVTVKPLYIRWIP